MNKKILYALMIGFLVVVSFVYFNQEEEKIEVKNCPNFNGKDFLLSGGSKVLTTQEDIQREGVRMFWLCNGGSS